MECKGRVDKQQTYTGSLEQASSLNQATFPPPFFFFALASHALTRSDRVDPGDRPVYETLSSDGDTPSIVALTLPIVTVASDSPETRTRLSRLLCWQNGVMC